MRQCPWCAEAIQDAARICRYCGRNAVPDAPAPLLEQGGHYDVPVRLEKQSHGGGGAGVALASSSTGVAFKGSVCPTCKSADYVQTYSVWHGVLAIGFFPIGLAGFAFPIKQCNDCGNRYGAGLEMTRVLGMIAIGFAVIVTLIIVAASGASR